MIEGKIIKGVGGLYTVTDGNEFYQCKARGIFRKENLTPCVGDNVTVSREGFIESIHERKNILIRPPVANIDNLAIVMSAQLPIADLLMLDKLTVTAFHMRIIPFVIINKCDIADAQGIERIVDHLYGTGIEYTLADCVTERGKKALVSSLHTGITAFAGQSGVGKTSILNIFLPYEHYEVGELSEKLERGRHTTRHVELHRIEPDKYIMDTPGFSRYDSEIKDQLDLVNSYPELKQFEKKCAFNSCTHTHEPDCAVKDAVKENIISKSRYTNYKILVEQLKSGKDIYK